MTQAILDPGIGLDSPAHRPLHKFAIWSGICLFAVLSIFLVNGYAYGVRDHWMVVPFVHDYINPALYPDDLFIDLKLYYYTFLFPLIAWIHRITALELPLIFFALYAISLAATFGATYRLAMILFGRTDVAFLSLFLLLFYRGHFPPSPVLDVWLMPRTIAVPIILFALGDLLNSRSRRCFLMLGCSFLIHPMNAAYGVAFAVVAMWRNFPVALLAQNTALFFLTACPLFFWMLMYKPTSGTFFNPTWLEILRARYGTMVFSLGAARFIQAGLRFLAFTISSLHVPADLKHRMVTAFVFTGFAMMVMGVVFTEWIPISLVVQMQFLRVFSLLIFFILIYYSNFLLSELKQPGILRPALALFLSVAVLLELNSMAEALARMHVFAGLLAISVFVYLRSRTTPQYGATATAVLIALTSVSVSLYSAWKNPYLPAFATTTTEDRAWEAAQTWAKENTEIDALFVVPPEVSGFRVHSQRSIYVDWKDGTMTFHFPDFGFEWLRRMNNSGYTGGTQGLDQYRFLTEKDLAAIAAETQSRPLYVVTGKDQPPLKFRTEYQNESYIIYRIR